MKEVIQRIRDFYIHKKKLAVGLTTLLAVLVAAVGAYAMIPVVTAAGEEGSSSANPKLLKANQSSEQIVQPNTWYRITGNSTDTYTLKYSGKNTTQTGPAYIILDNVSMTMTEDKPAIKFIAEEDNYGSYNGEFKVYIKGENTIRSTVTGATSALIQADKITYTVKTYDHDSTYTNPEDRFVVSSITKNCKVTFYGNNLDEDVLKLSTASGSYGAAIGSGELTSMGTGIRFKSGSGTKYDAGSLGQFSNEQQELDRNTPTKGMTFQNANIEVAQGAVILIESNGYGPGIGTGASKDAEITYNKRNATSTTSTSAATGSVLAETVLGKDSNIKISNGSVYVKTANGKTGACIGSGAIAGQVNKTVPVIIDGGNVEVIPGVEGNEFSKAINGNGKALHKYIFNIGQEADANGGTVAGGSTWKLENVEGGEEDYNVTVADRAGINDYLNLSIDNIAGSSKPYQFTGYAKEHFAYNSDTDKKLYFWLPSEVLPTSSLTVTGELPTVQYEYKVGTSESYMEMTAGTPVMVKQTKSVSVRLNNVPAFCTAVTAKDSQGHVDTITKDENGEYIYRFTMPQRDCTVNFTYEIGKFNISYHFGTANEDDVENPNPAKSACGEELELKAPAWKNHTFAGWYTTPTFEEGSMVTEVSSDVVGETVELYAKWKCKVRFVDDEGNSLDELIVDMGSTFTENMYPANPEDTDEKAFEGWTVNGVDYEVGSRPQFTVDQDTVIKGRYREIGYYVYIGATYTDEEDYTSMIDIKTVASFEMFFQKNPLEFVQETIEGGVLYKTAKFADRTDVTTGRITAKMGYKVVSVEVKDEQGEPLELFTSMDDEHAFTFTMPAKNVYITVHMSAPDYTISYHDTDGTVIVPVETEDNPTRYEFNAKTESFDLNPAPETDKYVKFVGWYVFGDSEKTPINRIEKGAYGSDLILVAKWEDVVTYPISVAEDVQKYIKVYDADGNEVDKGIPGEKLTIEITPGAGVAYESMTYGYVDEDGGVYTNKKTPSEDQEYPCTYKFNMPEYAVSVTGEFSLIEYTISYINLYGAKNPNPTIYTIESVITLEDLTKEGNEFKGWTNIMPDPANGANSVKQEPISVIENMTGNLILMANWENEENGNTLYKIFVDSESLGNGEINPFAEEGYEGQYIFLSAKPNRGYKLTALHYDNDKVETYSAGRALRAIESLFDMQFDLPLIEIADGIYYFIMPNHDITIRAEFAPIEYEISYVDGHAADNPTTYTVESVISLTAPSKDGYEFLGWYDEEDNLVSEIRDCIGNLTLTAKWKEIPSNDEPETPDVPQQPEQNPNPPMPPQPPQQPQPPTGGDHVSDSTNKSDTSSLLQQLIDMINDKGKVNSSENTAAENNKNTGSSQIIATGDRANISHLLLLCLLSLIILIIACPKKKDEDEETQDFV